MKHCDYAVPFESDARTGSLDENAAHLDKQTDPRKCKHKMLAPAASSGSLSVLYPLKQRQLPGRRLPGLLRRAEQVAAEGHWRVAIA